MEKQRKSITLDVDATEVNQGIKKVQRLVKLLKEVNSLANELTSKNLKITIYI